MYKKTNFHNPYTTCNSSHNVLNHYNADGDYDDDPETTIDTTTMICASCCPKHFVATKGSTSYNVTIHDAAQELQTDNSFCCLQYWTRQSISLPVCPLSYAQTIHKTENMKTKITTEKKYLNWTIKERYKIKIKKKYI